jgi:hypothetical protein
LIGKLPDLAAELRRLKRAVRELVERGGRVKPEADGGADPDPPAEA